MLTFSTRKWHARPGRLAELHGPVSDLGQIRCLVGWNDGSGKIRLSGHASNAATARPFRIHALINTMTISAVANTSGNKSRGRHHVLRRQRGADRTEAQIHAYVEAARFSATCGGVSWYGLLTACADQRRQLSRGRARQRASSAAQRRSRASLLIPSSVAVGAYVRARCRAQSGGPFLGWHPRCIWLADLLYDRERLGRKINAQLRLSILCPAIITGSGRQIFESIQRCHARYSGREWVYCWHGWYARRIRPYNTMDHLSGSTVRTTGRRHRCVARDVQASYANWQLTESSTAGCSTATTSRSTLLQMRVPTTVFPRRCLIVPPGGTDHLLRLVRWCGYRWRHHHASLELREMPSRPPSSRRACDVRCSRITGESRLSLTKCRD